MKYTATTDTILKKAPVQGSTLPEDQKVNVPQGKIYDIEKVIENDGLHSQVELAFDAGSWWIFLPHWDTGEAKPDVTPTTTGIVTAVFTLNQARTSNLINGTLTFFEDDKQILSVVATSEIFLRMAQGLDGVVAETYLTSLTDFVSQNPAFFVSVLQQQSLAIRQAVLDDLNTGLGTQKSRERLKFENFLKKLPTNHLIVQQWRQFNHD